MEFNEYQEKATKFHFCGDERSRDELLAIFALGAAGESGEIADHVKKALRGDCTLDEKKEDVCKEIGDVLWYLAMLAEEYGTTLDEIAVKNIAKLESRTERGKMRGSGDNR